MLLLDIMTNEYFKTVREDPWHFLNWKVYELSIQEGQGVAKNDVIQISTATSDLKTSFIRVRENLRDSRMPRRREYFLHETIRYVWGILFDNLHLSR